MVSQRMLQLGTARSVIRELFEYGRQRAAEVGAENVFDFSLGNPSVPAPAAVNETAIRLLREQGDTIHCYTSAPGDTGARQRIADSLNRRFGEHYTADELYLTVGAAASLCCVFNGLTCPGDEYILFAPYFPEYKVFIEGARGKVQVIAPEIEQFQIDFTAFEKAVNCRTKGVVINSPNNPSGVVYSRQTLETLAAILRAKEALYGHPIYLISDEPYREIAFDPVHLSGYHCLLLLLQVPVPAGRAAGLCAGAEADHGRGFRLRCCGRCGAFSGLCQRAKSFPAGYGGVLRPHQRHQRLRAQLHTADGRSPGDGLPCSAARWRVLSVPTVLGAG